MKYDEHPPREGFYIVAVVWSDEDRSPEGTPFTDSETALEYARAIWNLSEEQDNKPIAMIKVMRVRPDPVKVMWQRGEGLFHINKLRIARRNPSGLKKRRRRGGPNPLRWAVVAMFLEEGGRGREVGRFKTEQDAISVAQGIWQNRHPRGEQGHGTVQGIAVIDRLTGQSPYFQPAQNPAHRRGKMEVHSAYKKIHDDRCIILALSEMYNVPARQMEYNYYLFDKRLHPDEKKFISEHCTCERWKQLAKRNPMHRIRVSIVKGLKGKRSDPARFFLVARSGKHSQILAGPFLSKEAAYQGFKHRRFNRNPRQRRMGKLLEVRYERDWGKHPGYYKHTFSTPVEVFSDGNKIVAR